jgi:hypothetical protein
MTQDEIIEMARQAGCFEKNQVFYFTQQELEAFAKLVAKKEEEETMKAFCKIVIADYKLVIADYKQKIEDLENMLQNFRGVNNDTR